MDERFAHEPYQYAVIRGACPGQPTNLTRAGPEVPSDLSHVSCQYQCDIDPQCRGFVYDDNNDDHCTILYSICSRTPDLHNSAAKTYVKINRISSGRWTFDSVILFNTILSKYSLISDDFVR